MNMTRLVPTKMKLTRMTTIILRVTYPLPLHLYLTRLRMSPQVPLKVLALLFVVVNGIVCLPLPLGL